MFKIKKFIIWEKNRPKVTFPKINEIDKKNHI
jgi:hypothetical protein